MGNHYNAQDVSLTTKIGGPTSGRRLHAPLKTNVAKAPFISFILARKRTILISNRIKKIHKMETILEQQRRYHEEKERLMDAKTKEMMHKKTTVS